MINICFIGAGFVGGCSGAVFASKCPNNIYVLDSDENKIKMWNSNNFPIKEKYLQELIEKKNKNLTFTTDNRVLKKCELIFICVNTPNDTKDKPNLKYIESAMETIAKRNNKAIIVTKSTVPVGGNDRLINFLRQKNNSVNI